MSLRIANNVSSLTAANNLLRSNKAMNRSLERLSSGFKVNRGADGPAALVISEKQRAQIAGLEQAIENSEKAVSVVQTAEGALNEINSLLVKVRSLALDSANEGVNDADALAANQAEITNALETIDRIASNTQFSTKKLLDGSAGVAGTATDSDVTVLKANSNTLEGDYSVNVTSAATRANVNGTVDTSGGLTTDETLTINGIDVDLTDGMSQTQVLARINSFSSQTGVTAVADGGDQLVFYSNQFGDTNTAGDDISVVSDQAAGAGTTGVGTTALTGDGTDIAAQITNNATTEVFNVTGSGNVLTGTSGDVNGLVLQIAADGTDPTTTVAGSQGTVEVTNNSLIFQIGPNSNQTAAVAIDNVATSALGLGGTGQFSDLSSIDVTLADGAQESIAVIDQAIDEITNMRGTLGAFQQNTLEATASNLRTTLENSVNAESVIRDTDFASEIAEFTKQQVLVQAGTSLLASANQSSQLVLSLL